MKLVDVRSPAGDRFEYHVAELPRFASALVVVDARVLLLWKYRFPVDRWGYELPGGMIDDGETPAESAARETVEETGWQVRGEPEYLFTAEPLPGQVRGQGEVHRWHGAVRIGEATDPEEAQTVAEWVPVARAPELVHGGRMLDSIAATAVLYQFAVGLRAPTGEAAEPCGRHDDNGPPSSARRAGQ